MSRYAYNESFRTVHQALEQYTVPDIRELANLIGSCLPALCLPAGEQIIVVPKENKSAFLRNLRKLEYGVVSL